MRKFMLAIVAASIFEILAGCRCAVNSMESQTQVPVKPDTEAVDLSKVFLFDTADFYYIDFVDSPIDSTFAVL